MLKPLEIVVGGSGPYDPAANTTDCNIPSLKGNVIWIEKTGYGHYDYAKYLVLSNGGFRLTDTTFTAGERFVVHPVGMAYDTDATSYSNGFNVAQVMSAMFGRVGWLQPTEVGAPVVNSANLLSKSGRKFNDGSFHAAVTIRNIKSIMEEAKASDVALNATLESLQRAAIMRSLTTVFNRQEYTNQGLLYRTNSYNRDLVSNSGSFVGVEFFLPEVVHQSMQIDTVSILLNESKTFNLYLFHAHRKTPVWVGEVSVVADQETHINLSDLIINCMGPTNHSGLFYFGYFQDDLGSAKAYDHNNKYENHGQFMRWRFFDSQKLAGEYDFDRANVSHSSTCYGINLHLSTFRDHTWQTVQKAFLFDNLVGMQLSVQVMESLIYSKRLNGDASQLKDTLPAALLMQDVTGISQISNVPKIQGLRETIELEAARIRNAVYGKPEPISVSIC